MQKVYVYSLHVCLPPSYASGIVMTTHVDEPDPRADLEFWDRFMKGDCYMSFDSWYEEEVEDDLG